jgi:hypothetical protein
MMIEAFREIAGEDKAVASLKTWLLRNKQTSNWKTGIATADACYALLNGAANLTQSDGGISVALGDSLMVSPSSPAEGGTGYWKKSIAAAALHGQSSLVISRPTANNDSTGFGWGAVYWQYFESSDHVKAAGRSLMIERNLYRQENTDRGPVLMPVENNGELKVGDKIVIRMILRNDRPMEYVHLKDMRATTFEPAEQLSTYVWKNGLGYYEATGDVNSEFFIDYLPKGTHVFEYGVFVTHNGTFNSGIARLQCLYAPEFVANSSSITINVRE